MDKTINIPDGGWGYIVMMSAFFVAFIIDGTANSFGLLLPILVDTFSVSVPLASLSSGVLTGVTFLIAPVTARLVKRFGHRSVAFLGSLVTFGSMAIASFSVNIEMFIIFYGAIAGVGLGLVYLPSITMVNSYFERKRGIALGVVTCGSGIGLLILAFLIELFIRIYGWRGCRLIISGFYLNLCICASLLRPLKNREIESSERSPSSSDKDSTDVKEWPRESDEAHTKYDEEQEDLKQIFKGETKHFNEPDTWKGRLKYQISNSSDVKQLQSYAYSDISTNTSQTMRFTEGAMDEASRSENLAAQHAMLRLLEGKSSSCITMNGRVKMWDEKGQRTALLSSPFDAESEKFLNDKELIGFPRDTCPLRDVSGELVSSRKNAVNSRQDLLPMWAAYSNLSLDSHDVSKSRHKVAGDVFYYQASLDRKNRNLGTPLFVDAVRICKQRHEQQAELMVRSLLRLPKNGSLLMLNQPLEMTDRWTSVTSLTSRCTTQVTSRLDDFSLPRDDHSDDITITSSKPKALLRDHIFILFCTGAFLTQLANNLPGMYIPSFALNIGLSSAQAANIVSILGISNTVGRFIAGYISFMGLSSLRTYNTGIVLGGIACILVLFCSTYAHLLVLAAVLGFSLGSVPPLQSVILVELLGIERLPSSFGIMCFCKSIACMSGPSLAGGLYEIARDYQVTLVFAGGIFLLAGLLHVVLGICRPNGATK